jgi:hypothetical protein
MQQYLTHSEKTTTMTSKKVHCNVLLSRKRAWELWDWTKTNSQAKVKGEINLHKFLKGGQLMQIRV